MFEMNPKKEKGDVGWKRKIGKRRKKKLRKNKEVQD
jgi:hypothetical protein